MNKLVPVLFTLILATGCTERINVKLDNTYVRLVVDGGITNDSLLRTVALTRSADYFSNEPASQVPDAKVTLSDGSTLYTLHETIPGVSGIYQTDSTFRGSIGKTYALNIDLPAAIGNQTSYSASCRIMKVARLDSIRAEFNPNMGKNGFWLIKIYAQDPGDEVNYYLLKYYRNGVLKTDSIKKWVTSDDKYFSGRYINGLTAFYINNSHPWETLQPGDTLLVQMSGITKEYFNFINQVQEAGYSIPFFSGPPANVEGNISNGGIGFFAAYSNVYARTIVPQHQ